MSEEVVATYTLQLLSNRSLRRNLRLRRNLLREVEENLTDLLPGGYRVIIREWDGKEHSGNEEHQGL
jgi:hypothetical protein